MPELIGEEVPQVLEVISSSFMFRKLGICYDLKALPDEFPRKSLPTAQDVKDVKPDATGSYTGIHDCITNNALLFDGYALRLEIGFADEAKEERVYDRLIGGAIRLSTIAPQNAILCGLSSDGKSFYPQTNARAYLAWAFYAWRIVTTPTVLQDSQAKVKNIASRWISKLASDDFVLPYDNKELVDGSWQSEPLVAGLLAAAWVTTGEDKWKKLALEKASFSTALPETATGSDLLTQQLALHMIAEIFPEEEIGKKAKARMLQILPLAIKLLAKASDYTPKEYEQEPSLDWHEIDDLNNLPQSWEAFVAERDTVGEAIIGALVCVLCADGEALKPYAAQLSATITAKPWDKFRLAATLCPVASIHARGVELGLWDESLQDYSIGFDGDEALVSRYMSEDFDELNPDKSGHVSPPKKELPLELREEKAPDGVKSKNSRKRRRRRRKK